MIDIRIAEDNEFCYTCGHSRSNHMHTETNPCIKVTKLNQSDLNFKLFWVDWKLNYTIGYQVCPCTRFIPKEIQHNWMINCIER